MNNNKLNYLGVMVILGIAPYYDSMDEKHQGESFFMNKDNELDVTNLRNQHQWLYSPSPKESSREGDDEKMKLDMGDMPDVSNTLVDFSPYILKYFWDPSGSILY